jgi:mRNA-degrading endonuclease toxin of MazEF toxin-antitoxin module
VSRGQSCLTLKLHLLAPVDEAPGALPVSTACGAAHGVVAPLKERTAPDLTPAFLVPLTGQDWPTAAVIDLSRLRSLDTASIAGQAGQLTPGTLGALTTAVRTYLGAADH